MNRSQEQLRFDRVRTFGRVMADTRSFVRDNFSAFFKTILFVVGPFILLTCTLESFYKIQNETTFFGDGAFAEYLAGTFIIHQLRWVINGIITAMAVSHFIKVYREKGSERFDANDVGASIGRDILGNLLALIMMLIIVVLLSTLIGYIIYGLAEVNAGLAALLIGVGFVVYFLVRFPVWYFIFSVFMARTTEKKTINVFAAIGEAAKVFSGAYWKTWVIFFVMWLILYLIGTLISLPAEVLSSVLTMLTIDSFLESSDEYKMLQAILLSVGEFAKTIVNSVFCISVALHFYSLKEQTDGQGTKELVDTIGTKTDDDGVELTY
jgi:hypothetical protein